MLDSISEGFVLFDDEDHLALCNETYRAFYSKVADLLVPGTPFEAIVRASIERGQFAESGQCLDELVDHRLELRNVEHCEHEQQLFDGRWLRVTERLLQNGWILGTRIDITRLKQREKALESAHQQLFDAIEALQEGFALFDAEDRMVLCNDNYRRLFPLVGDLIQPGAKFDHLIRAAARRGQNVQALEDKEEWVKARLSVHALTSGTFEHQFADGRHVRVSERKTKDGSTLSTYVDISQLKERERELIAATAAAEEANRAKSEFLAKMSHELRTPLNAIIGFSDMLRNEMWGPIGNPRYREYTNDIHHSGTHLLSLISELLDISKIEAGEMTIMEGEVDLVDVFNACRRMMAQQADACGVDLAVKLPVEPMLLYVDQHAIKRVLLNLLSNAVKFTSRGGAVVLSCGLGDADHVLLSVSDTGIGIKEKDIPRVLKPFVQLTPMPDKPGTGLGLPIAKHLVELHEGRLELESNPGKGTTVTVRLPPYRRLPVEVRRLHANAI